MKERPMLFSAPMVRAILKGRKTQTRRAVKLPSAPDHLGEWLPDKVSADAANNSTGMAIPLQACIWHSRTGQSLMCPYGQPGDRLWLRETWAYVPASAYRCSDGVMQTACPSDPDMAAVYAAGWDRSRPGRWRPSIHMPRWASRITLEVTGVRVERLQDISEADAVAEGCAIECMRPDGSDNGTAIWNPGGFVALWESINGPGSWDANPWVWVVEFARIDSASAAT